MTVTKPSVREPPWLLLVFSLAKSSASLRVSVWRQLQRYGVVALGNSGYLLPNGSENRERFEWLATSIRSHRGEASIVEVGAIDNCSSSQLKARFSAARAHDYRELLKDLRTAVSKPARLARLHQRFQRIVSIDFFGDPLRAEVERALDRSGPNHAEIGRRSRREYQKKVWVTRPRPGIDRVASAWLIRNFIDSRARFAFASESHKPAGSVPFDMYQGGFGHRGEECTFETLTKAFGIGDKRVAVIAQIVHDADLFDDKFGRHEGFGIDAVLKGWARQGLTDQQLLDRGMQLAEGLYQSLGQTRLPAPDCPRER